MAFRLDKVIVKGEISNQERGRVTGKIWLLGRKEPVVLDVKGNCMKDLAGCALKFENPVPRREQLVELLDSAQTGYAGDMTASRKSRVPTVTEEKLMQLLNHKKPIPYVLANTLYLEWFSEQNGRVVVESADFNLEITEPAWSMTAPEEKEQAIESQDNFYRFLDQLTGVSAVDEEEEDFLEEEDEEEEEDPEIDGEWDSDVEALPLNEFQWEQELREADKRAEAYQEAFDRYKDSPDRERLIAEAMGWDAEEEMEDFREEWDDVAESLEESDPQFQFRKQLKGEFESVQQPAGEVEEEEEDDDEEPHHPLSRRAMRFALRLQEDAERLGLMSEEQPTRESPLLSVIVSIIAMGGKLAAALDGVALGYDPDPGFIVAMLKRAQIPLNEALHSLGSIDSKHLSQDTRMWLATARSELFDLRKDILDVMKEMREM